LPVFNQTRIGIDSIKGASGRSQGSEMEFQIFRMKFVAKAMVLGAIAAISAWSQPTPAPTTGDLACKEDADVVGTDTVVSTIDADGYASLFDGTFKGWFQSCKTGHSNGSTQGAIFRLGTADAKPAIYTTQRSGTIGGIMMTNKKYTNYEITFETWPDYGNDAGLFNRTPINGNCFQTVLDYIGSASVGGTWGEGGFTSRDYRPWAYNSETSLAIPGNGNGELSNWTTITQKLKASTEPNLPCATTGCVQADYLKLWDVDGWNQIKIQFYGGSASGTGNLHMKSWFKKPADNIWVPVIQDTTLAQVVPAGYIGLQVHGSGRFGGAKGTWYRNIRWRPLSDKGIPLPGYTGGTSGVQSAPMRAPNFKLTANSAVISGTIDMDYSITVKDAAGRSLESFSGKPGAVNHAFSTNARGVLFLSIKTAFGIQTAHVVRASI
jgi:hypothetical protein